MGMFDYVKYDGKCPECGALNTEWQSKDADCVMATLKPEDVRHFYTPCWKCGVWINAEAIPNGINVVLTAEHLTKQPKD